MATVEVRGISKRFADTVAIQDIDFTLYSGESMVVLGPSGSGKSTMLRVLAGLESPDTGEILVGGVRQNGLPAHQRDVAIVFQHFALYPHLTAEGNITLGLQHGLKLDKREAVARAHAIAERLEITHLLKRLPRQMSGGQRQRVALARALARQSGVVLLDEPLSGLDAQLRLTMRAEIGAALRASGSTSVHVTHDQTDAMAMADRIAIVRDGAIVQLGTPTELYNHPNSLFTATFIGSPPMNILTPVARRTPFGTLSHAHDPGLVLGIRPEHLVLGEESCPWVTRGDVVLVEHEGPSDIVHLDCEGTALRARTNPNSGVTVGSTIAVGCHPRDMHAFGQDGARYAPRSTLLEPSPAPSAR